ncbi:apolipo A-I-like protein [Labeo rohita]|uniref:Apolipo A-I-like protein n=1 Tax=Labeo rohita TaxID=84645 RepID=A0A498LQ94_LABRO|nr:apolipo A-I-like protein [Labeo rohita]
MLSIITPTEDAMTLCLEKVKEYDFYADLFVWRLSISCQANLFYADEPKPLLEQLTNAFWSYVAQATRTTEDTLKMIRESQLGQEVNVRMTQSADIASEYAVTLKEQMDPMLEELRSKITKETEVFMELLSQNLIGIRDKLKPYSDNLKRQIQETVKKFIDAVGSFTP